jgi:hypothetical protein
MGRITRPQSATAVLTGLPGADLRSRAARTRQAVKHFLHFFREVALLNERSFSPRAVVRGLELAPGTVDGRQRSRGLDEPRRPKVARTAAALPPVPTAGSLPSRHISPPAAAEPRVKRSFVSRGIGPRADLGRAARRNPLPPGAGAKGKRVLEARWSEGYRRLSSRREL